MFENKKRREFDFEIWRETSVPVKLPLKSCVPSIGIKSKLQRKISFFFFSSFGKLIKLESLTLGRCNVNLL